MTASICYFKPRHDSEAGPLIIDPELIGQEKTVLNHSGLLMEFIWTVHDVNDEDGLLKTQLESVYYEFRATVEAMSVEERLEMIMEYSRENPTVALLAPKVWLADGEVPFLPSPEKVSPEDMLKAIVPFPKVRSLLHHWDTHLKEAPIQSVQISQSAICKGREFQTAQIVH